MIEFGDILYGRIGLPGWLEPFIRLPEFVRLRGVGLSNVDSIEFKDFSASKRWEHSIAVAYLAKVCAEERGLNLRDTVHLILAGLMHDIATPPFGHTMEYVLDGFDHEMAGQSLVSDGAFDNEDLESPVFDLGLPHFGAACEQLEKTLAIDLDPQEIARLIVGDGELGFLVSGSLDLDNADNVTRACFFLGMDVDRGLPVRLARWLAGQQTRPTGLPAVDNRDIETWLQYKYSLYSTFYSSSDAESGREAFLQHLLRRALAGGLPLRSLVWSTEDRLFSSIERLREPKVPAGWPSIRQLAIRYRLLESPRTLAVVPVEDERLADTLSHPRVARWIEERLSSKWLEVFVAVQARRFDPSHLKSSTLFPPPAAVVRVFSLCRELKHRMLPDFLASEIPGKLSGRRLKEIVADRIKGQVYTWSTEKPWLSGDEEHRSSVKRTLGSIKNWDFPLSRNEQLHPYPGTFVHAIPSVLIRSLGLQGETVLDPFGGTGQTAVEVVKTNGTAIVGDINRVALLAAKARLTHLGCEDRTHLRSIKREDLEACSVKKKPDFEAIESWHHPDTSSELAQIRDYISRFRNESFHSMLMASFSAILPNCTARRGRQHGFFADNTPLARDEKSPPYIDAIELFLSRVSKNLDLTEKLYAHLERRGRRPEAALGRVKILRIDAREAAAKDYGVQEESVAGIVTSPPYLCAPDYTLGQRLSYYWLFPEGMASDFDLEIGARRRRFSPEKAWTSYVEGLRGFSTSARGLLRAGGVMATVLGVPVAKAFKDIDILGEADSILAANGLKLIWNTWRGVRWHRNHGYARIKKERVSVYIRES